MHLTFLTRPLIIRMLIVGAIPIACIAGSFLGPRQYGLPSGQLTGLVWWAGILASVPAWTWIIHTLRSTRRNPPGLWPSIFWGMLASAITAYVITAGLWAAQLVWLAG